MPSFASFNPDGAIRLGVYASEKSKMSTPSEASLTQTDTILSFELTDHAERPWYASPIFGSLNWR